MIFSEYLPLALRTESPRVILDMSEARSRSLHALLGMATECGELLDALKKHLVYGKPLDFVNWKEELGDFCWYLALYVAATAAPEPYFTPEPSSSAPVLRAVAGLNEVVGRQLRESTVAGPSPRDLPDRFVFQVTLYLQALADFANLAFSDIFETNIRKLQTRYGDKYSDVAALTRDLQAERATLEETPWPMCGANACLAISQHVDVAGIGWCDAHVGDALPPTRPASNVGDFDPWITARSGDARFSELDYGVWPEGMTPPEHCRPGWGLPPVGANTTAPQEE